MIILILFYEILCEYSFMALYHGFRFYRQRCGLPQKVAAEKLNITPVTLCFYESGKTEPNIEILIKMSKLYNVSIDDLVQFKPTQNQSPDMQEYKSVLSEMLKYNEKMRGVSFLDEKSKKELDEDIERLKKLLERIP